MAVVWAVGAPAKPAGAKVASLGNGRVAVAQ